MILQRRKRSLLRRIGKVGANFVWKGKYVEDAEKLFVGENVYIGPGARLFAKGKIVIEDGVISGPNLTIYTYNHNYRNAKYLPYDELFRVKSVHIERNVWLGDSVSIIPGVRIGEGSIIGLRSVVVSDIPPFSIVGGNPAKVIKQRDDIDNYLKLRDKSSNYLYHKKLLNLKSKIEEI